MLYSAHRKVVRGSSSAHQQKEQKLSGSPTLWAAELSTFDNHYVFNSMWVFEKLQTSEKKYDLTSIYS